MSENDDDTDIHRRIVLALTGAAITATSGCLGFLSDGGDDSEEDDQSGPEQPDDPQQEDTSTSGGGDNTTSGTETETETVNDTTPDEPGQESVDTLEEDSTQPETTTVDDAVETSNVTPYFSQTECAVTGEVWNVSDESIDEVIVEVTLLDATGTALTDEPLVDGTFGLEPDGVFFFEVRTRSEGIAGSVEDFEYSVTALQDDY